MDDEEGATYTDAFCGETLHSATDAILRIVVSRLDGGGARQEFYVRRDCFVRALDSQIPLGEVFDDE